MEILSIPVLVLGGGTGAIGAALQCARSGTACLLITPGPWVGGMLTSSGVSAPDGNEINPFQTGLWGALLRQLRQTSLEGLDQNWVSCFGFRPGDAEAIFQSWIKAESQLQWRSEYQLEEITKKDDRLLQARFSNETTLLVVNFDLLIDGTELGDSLALAQIPHRVGWEAKEKWGEPSAPSQVRINQDPFFKNQPVQSPTWVIFGKWLGDWSCSSSFKHLNQKPRFPFENCLKPHGLLKTLSYGRLPGDWLMLNWPIDGNDWHDDPGAPFSGSPDRIANHLMSMQEHSLSFLKELQYLSNRNLEPANAFPKGKANGSLALQAYWRESRRLIGCSTVVEQDLLVNNKNNNTKTDLIAIGNYPNDHHYPGQDWPLAPKSRPWGGRWSGTPFGIPFSALHGNDIINLIMADKGISVSHIANGATRLGPVVLNIGQAAGLAAAICCDKNILPHQLDVMQLQIALINDQIAPSAPSIIDNLPTYSKKWRQIQANALKGEFELINPEQAPEEPGEECIVMELNIQSEENWKGRCGNVEWPLITLEPQVKEQIEKFNGKRINIVGRCNPWGTWWRINRLLP
jgi:hypothetical protein